MIVYIFGSPGSGKTFISNYIRNSKNYQYISCGDIYREFSNINDERVNKLKTGEIKLGDLIIGRILETIQDLNGNILIDGLKPQQLSRFQSSIGRIDLIIELVCKKEIAYERMISRERDNETPEVINIRLNKFEDSYNFFINIINKYCKKYGTSYLKINSNENSDNILNKIDKQL